MLVWPNPNWSNRRLAIQWYVSLRSKWVLSILINRVTCLVYSKPVKQEVSRTYSVTTPYEVSEYYLLRSSCCTNVVSLNPLSTTQSKNKKCILALIMLLPALVHWSVYTIDSLNDSKRACFWVQIFSLVPTKTD